jgi:hypothetical protein
MKDDTKKGSTETDSLIQENEVKRETGEVEVGPVLN